MNRIISPVLVVLLLTASGCGRNDSVVATFVRPKATETRLVFFGSGEYEQWLLKDGMPKHPFRSPLMKYELHNWRMETKIFKEPIETGIYIRTSTNLMITVRPDARHSAGWPTNRVYRIIQIDGSECLLDERFGSASTYDRSNHTDLFRLVWQQERR